MRLFIALCAALALSIVSFAGDATPFKRIPFNLKVELLEEAPGVAASGTQAAFASKKAIHVVDTLTGTAKEFPLPAEISNGDGDVYAAGMSGDAVHAVAIHFLDPNRLKPGDAMAQIGGGKPTSSWIVFSVSTKDGAYTRRFELSSQTYIADDMLGDNLVYAVGNELHIRAISGEPDQKFPLQDEPKRVPVVSNGEVFGVGAKSFYWIEADKSFHKIALAGTPLVALSERDIPVIKSRDLIVFPTENGLTACDLTGKLRWQQRIPGTPVASSDGDLYVNMACSAAKLAREDGHLIWGRYLMPDNFNRTQGAMAIDGKLVVINEHFISVLDGKSGLPVTGFSIEGKLVRTHSQAGAELLKTTTAAKVAVIGYEDRVYGIDLTPTADVPREQQSNDIANAETLLAEFEKAPAAFKGDKLVQLGQNLADTPSLTARALPLIKPRLKERDVLLAWQWLDDPIIANSLVAEKQTLRHYGSYQLAMAIAFLPNRKLAESTLNQIIDDKSSEAELREAATQFRAMMNPPTKLSKADRDIVYSGDSAAMLKYFKSSVTGSDAAASAHASELLKLAPDSVIADLGPSAAQIPDAKVRGEVEVLVKEAKARLAATEPSAERSTQVAVEGDDSINLAIRIATVIKVLEAKDYEKFLDRFLAPEQKKALVEKQSLKDAAKNFDKEAEMHLRRLRKMKVKEPKYTEGGAVVSYSVHDNDEDITIQFKRIDRVWYFMGHDEK